MASSTSGFGPILQAVGRHIQLSKDEQDFFCSLLEPRGLRRRQFLLKEGEVCRNSTFVVSGCLRGYTVDKNGFEHVLSFAPEGWWIGDMYSLLSQRPGNLNIEALEQTAIVQLPKPQQELLYEKVPAFERYFRILVENSLVASQQRLINNLSLTAEERYQNFCRQYPSLVDRLPQKHMAAFIGITPEFFSKMRSRLLRKKG